MNKRKRSPTRSQFVKKYRLEWQQELEWLRIRKTETSARCIFCNSDFRIGMGGLKDLRHHAITEYHQKNKRAAQQSTSMNSFVIPENHTIVDPTLQWANFVTENNLSIKLNDNFTKLVPKMFPDTLKELKKTLNSDYSQLYFLFLEAILPICDFKPTDRIRIKAKHLKKKVTVPQVDE